MENKDLSLLKKFIICDIISFQIQGNIYIKTSAKLAKELGDYKPKTVQTAFQELNNDGYIDCFPYNDDSGKEYDLRQAKVVQIEQWIYSDDYIKEKNINIKPLQKKEINHELRLAWRNRHSKKKKGVKPPTISEVAIEKEQNKVNEVKAEELLTPLRLKILEEMCIKEKIDFAKVVDFLISSEPNVLFQQLNYFDGVWRYKVYENFQQDLWENDYGIIYQFNGGNTCTLKMLDEDGKTKDRFDISLKNLQEYYDEKGVYFKDLKLKDFITLKGLKSPELTYY